MSIKDKNIGDTFIEDGKEFKITDKFLIEGQTIIKSELLD